MAERVFRMRMNFRAGKEPAAIVMHFVANLDESVDDFLAARLLMQEMLEMDVPTKWLPELLDCLSEDCMVSSMEIRQIHPIGGNGVYQQFEDEAVTGNVASPINTTETSMVMIWLSLERPGDVGRTFLPGLPTSYVDGGRFTAGANTAASNFAVATVTGFIAGGVPYLPCIWSKQEEEYREISDGYLSPNVGQMSRRGMQE